MTLKDYYAFVDYENHDSAVQAIAEMDGRKFLNGETIKVSQSRM